MKQNFFGCLLFKMLFKGWSEDCLLLLYRILEYSLQEKPRKLSVQKWQCWIGDHRSFQQRCWFSFLFFFFKLFIMPRLHKPAIETTSWQALINQTGPVIYSHNSLPLLPWNFTKCMLFNKLYRLYRLFYYIHVQCRFICKCSVTGFISCLIMCNVSMSN